MNITNAAECQHKHSRLAVVMGIGIDLNSVRADSEKLKSNTEAFQAARRNVELERVTKSRQGLHVVIHFHVAVAYIWAGYESDSCSSAKKGGR